MPQPRLTLPDVLCKLGRQLVGAEECIAVEEAISPLDKVRLAAFTGNVDSISCQPPLLGTDSMIPGELFLYSDSCQARILRGPHNMHEVRGLHVVGGAMMQTKTCKFPVSILYSDIKGGLVLHAGDVPIAKLEAEFYDSAFCESDAWAEYVMGSEANEFAQWRREAATGARSAGLGGTPQHLVGEDCYRVVRPGVTPFLSLRAPENEAEFTTVRDRLVDDLAVLPKGTRDLMKTYSQHKSIVMAFVGSSDSRLPRKDEIVEPPMDERFQSANTLLDNNPVLSWIASIILHCACDDAFDQQGEPIGEYYSGLKYKSTNERAVDSAKSDETSYLVRARNNKCTDIDNREVSDAEPFTLTAVMKDLNRSYATKSVCDLTGTESKVVMETVARAIFDADDAKLVADSCASNCTSNMTPVTAVSVLGKCLVDHQALAIVTRDPDGRISNAKLVGFQTVVPRLHKDSLARLLLFPWVTVLFVDKERVSVLLVKDPEHVQSAAFNREPLRLRESAKPRGAAGDATLQRTVEELKQEVASLKTENTAAITAIKDFEKKLNFLVEKKAVEQVDDPPPRPAPCVAPPPALPVVQAPPTAEDSDVVKSLKRTLATLTSFAAKRPCA
jgi:hypothetical protein